MMSLVLIAPTAPTGCCRVVLTDLSLQCCLDIWGGALGVEKVYCNHRCITLLSPGQSTPRY